MRPLHSTKSRLLRRTEPSVRAEASNEAGDTADRNPAQPTLPPYEWLTALDHSSQPAFVHDQDFRILRCNPAYARSAGMPVSDIVGRPYWQVLPKLDGAPEPCRLDQPRDGAQAQVVTTEDGRSFVIQETPAPCPKGGFWYCRHELEDVTARKKLEDDLARERGILTAIIESAPNTFFLVDEDGKLVRWNSYVEQRSGLSGEELLGHSALEFICEEDRPLAAAKLLTALATGSIQMEVRVGGDEKGPRHFLTTARRVLIDERPHVAGFCIDISERKRAEKALEEQKVFLDALVENIPGIFCVLDMEGNCLRWNSNVNKVTGFSDQDLYKRSSLLVIAEEDRAKAAAALREAFEKGFAKTVLQVITKERGYRPFLMTGRRFDVDGIPYLVGVGFDTTAELAAMSALEHDARTDGLTQIARRSHFMHCAEDEFLRCRRYGHPMSMWMVDLDHFKAVNDAHGHQAGDAVLREFVAIARQVLRDWDIIGRMGGEEFGVILPETDARKALLVAERLRQTVAATPLSVGDSAISITVSIGIAAMKQDDTDVQAILARADGALYEAKNTGRDKVAVVGDAG